MIIEICALVSTLFFIILVLFIIQFLKTGQKTLAKLNHLILKLEEKIEPVEMELKKLLYHSSQLTETVNQQITHLNPLMQAVSEVGKSLDSVTKLWNNKTSHFNGSEDKKKKLSTTISSVVEIAAVSLLVWQQINKRK